ncbi:PML-RARA-regulated adapter molecule 1 isoform X2 [Ixodes scapularis]|uniref:PML-RARA-regulated adapter molecule 1 isoform X2 n=1 Tax=Ixodes scapularis TaxID=6945 RepID=UPI001A9F82EE|nr:PML-RARA-regulated adapter molecule 1 isoform X2 [Ixodes scapularis]
MADGAETHDPVYIFSGPAVSLHVAEFRNIEVTTKDEDARSIVFWLIFGLFNLFDYYADLIRAHIPFFWLFKVLFLTWCLLPTPSNGVTVIYFHLLQPLFLGTDVKSQDGRTNRNTEHGDLTGTDCRFPPATATVPPWHLPIGLGSPPSEPQSGANKSMSTAATMQPAWPAAGTVGQAPMQSSQVPKLSPAAKPEQGATLQTNEQRGKGAKPTEPAKAVEKSLQLSRNSKDWVSTDQTQKDGAPKDQRPKERKETHEQQWQTHFPPKPAEELPFKEPQQTSGLDSGSVPHEKLRKVPAPSMQSQPSAPKATGKSSASTAKQQKTARPEPRDGAPLLPVNLEKSPSGGASKSEQKPFQPRPSSSKTKSKPDRPLSDDIYDSHLTPRRSTSRLELTDQESWDDVNLFSRKSSTSEGIVAKTSAESGSFVHEKRNGAGGSPFDPRLYPRSLATVPLVQPIIQPLYSLYGGYSRYGSMVSYGSSYGPAYGSGYSYSPERQLVFGPSYPNYTAGPWHPGFVPRAPTGLYQPVPPLYGTTRKPSLQSRNLSTTTARQPAKKPGSTDCGPQKKTDKKPDPKEASVQSSKLPLLSTKGQRGAVEGSAKESGKDSAKGAAKGMTKDAGENKDAGMSRRPTKGKDIPEEEGTCGGQNVAGNKNTAKDKGAAEDKNVGKNDNAVKDNDGGKGKDTCKGKDVSKKNITNGRETTREKTSVKNVNLANDSDKKQGREETSSDT